MITKEKKPKISIIACLAKDGGIGKNNKLLFDIPEDLKYFHKVTQKHPVIMGYNTYKSIGHPLSMRHNIVISKKVKKIPGYIVASDLDEAINKASKLQKDEIFIIGGASVYEQAIKVADKLYITEVDATEDADKYFPDYSNFTKRTKIGNGKEKEFKYTFYEYERE